MGFYKNTDSHIEEYKEFREYEVGTLVNYKGDLLIVEDANFFKDAAVCQNCYFDSLQFSKCPGFGVRCCSSFNRRDAREIIYKKVEL